MVRPYMATKEMTTSTTGTFIFDYEARAQKWGSLESKIRIYVCDASGNADLKKIVYSGPVLKTAYTKYSVQVVLAPAYYGERLVVMMYCMPYTGHECWIQSASFKMPIGELPVVTTTQAPTTSTSTTTFASSTSVPTDQFPSSQPAYQSTYQPVATPGTSSTTTQTPRGTTVTAKPVASVTTTTTTARPVTTTTFKPTIVAAPPITYSLNSPLTATEAPSTSGFGALNTVQKLIFVGVICVLILVLAFFAVRKFAGVPAVAADGTAAAVPSPEKAVAEKVEVKAAKA